MPTIPAITNRMGITEVGARGLIALGFMRKSATMMHTKVALPVTTSTRNVPFRNFGAMPQLTQFIKRRIANGIPDYSWTPHTEKFANLVEMERDAFEEDQTGQTRGSIQQLGVRAAEFPDILLFSRWAENPVGFDGSPIFSASHALGGNAPAVQTNVVQGQVTEADLTTVNVATNAQLIQEDFTAAVAQMANFIDNQGVKFNFTLDGAKLVIVCSQRMRPAMVQAFQSEFILQTANIFRGSIEGIIGTSLLDGTNFSPLGINASYTHDAATWYLCRVDEALKPWFNLLFHAPTTAELTDDLKAAGVTMEALQTWQAIQIEHTLNKVGDNADAYTITNDSFLMSVRAKMNIVPGFWPYIVQVQAAAEES